ncbi:hypothetical protein KV205_31700 [Streptomyces sp. SKN60]|uniref:hypothetical protein n=1 Tax=Streptomyces sp. SKN60 TaxID=2855506 RepID=UPI0022460352|nr:hypothetical protein [Streptomyces sp. SKN60]MCX2185042.1 hypothetical protein [Streptomyces sp. SKN60]
MDHDVAEEYTLPDVELARLLLVAIHACPDRLDEDDWLSIPSWDADLGPHRAVPAGTRLSIAAWAAHLDGWTLRSVDGNVEASKEECVVSVCRAGQLALGLSDRDAAKLFDPGTDTAEALLAVWQIADGARAIDWAIDEMKNRELNYGEPFGADWPEPPAHYAPGRGDVWPERPEELWWGDHLAWSERPDGREWSFGRARPFNN